MLSPTSGADLHLGSKGVEVSGLQIYSSRAFEFASQSFARTETRKQTARGNPLNIVFAVPCNKVAIVNEVSLPFHQLFDKVYISTGMTERQDEVKLRLS